MSELVPVEISGRTRSLTVGQALARRMVQQAMAGDRGALREVLLAQQRYAERMPTVIKAELVFEEEEHRYMKTNRENDELRAEVERLHALLPSS